MAIGIRKNVFTVSDVREQPWYIEAAELAGMPFPQAAEAWLASRTPYISKKTFHEYHMNVVTLSKFFGEMTLKEISAEEWVGFCDYGQRLENRNHTK